MSIDEIEAVLLRLSLEERARLAEKVLESLEDLSSEERERLWVEEATRRDEEWDTNPSSGRPAEDVLRDAFTKLN